MTALRSPPTGIRADPAVADHADRAVAPPNRCRRCSPNRLRNHRRSRFLAAEIMVVGVRAAAIAAVGVRAVGPVADGVRDRAVPAVVGVPVRAAPAVVGVPVRAAPVGDGVLRDRDPVVLVPVPVAGIRVVPDFLRVRPDQADSGRIGTAASHPVFPQPQFDPCAGEFVGTYEDGQPLAMWVSRTGGNQVSLQVLVDNRWNLQGWGTCDVYPDNQAEMSVDVNGDQHEATIDRGVMNGADASGYRFTIFRQ